MTATLYPLSHHITIIDLIKEVKVHGFFVPALAFTLPIKTTTGSTTKKREKAKEATNDKKEGDRGGAVISVGADYACMLTPIVHQSFVSILFQSNPPPPDFLLPCLMVLTFGR
jgi:hypothetical protein